jgi:hypothetical protein
MRKIYLYILLAVLVTPAFAQKRIFQEVGQDISTSAQPIMENDVLVGYLALTQLEKVSKDSFSYRLTIMDENLNDLGVVNFHELKLRLEDVMIEDNILCLAYVKSNVLGYRYEHRADRNKAIMTGKAWMLTQFINLKGEIIKTAQVQLNVDLRKNWNDTYIPASVLKNAISVKNMTGKGFVCLYQDDSKKNLVFYDLKGNQTWERRISEEGKIEHFKTSDHDVYVMMQKELARNKYQYTVYSYNADDNTVYQKYMLKDKKGNDLLPLGFENDPISGKPDISGLIYNPKFRKYRKRDEGLKIRKGMYGGVFNVELTGHKKGEMKEQFTYWYDDSKGDVTNKGYFSSGAGYITPNKSFRDFNGNTYYTGSVIKSRVRGRNIGGGLFVYGLTGLLLGAGTGNPALGIGYTGICMAFGHYREFPTGNALIMKMDTTGKVKYENTLPINGSKETGDYNFWSGTYCFTVVSPEDKLTYLVMSDDKAYVIYSVEQKKVVRTIRRDDAGKSVMVLPAKEGSVIVITRNMKERYTVMSIEAV